MREAWESWRERRRALRNDLGAKECTWEARFLTKRAIFNKNRPLGALGAKVGILMHCVGRTNEIRARADSREPGDLGHVTCS